MNLADVTCLIPLYRSEPLLEYVFANIDQHIRSGAAVICSDEHGLDDAASIIRRRHAGSGLVTVIEAADASGGNWVSNCNRLIAACNTPFFRIIPHDDSVEAEATARLAAPLRSDPAVVLSHGWVRAETLDGDRLPARDEPRMPLRPIDSDLAFSAAFFWQGLFGGAFKALIRHDVWRGGPLLIRSTPDSKHSERAWLFGLSLLGKFAFTDDAVMTKRYWSGSLTDRWTARATGQMDVADVMASYVDDLVEDETVQATLRRNLYVNAMRRANWLDGLTTQRPEFELPEIRRARYSDRARCSRVYARVLSRERTAMRLETSQLIGFSVVEMVDAQTHARISEVPPGIPRIADVWTRNGEIPDRRALPISSMFAREGETPDAL